MRMRTIGKVLLLAMAVSGIAALSVAQTAQKPAFEVVSIKRNTSGQGGGAITTAGGRFVAKGATLSQLVNWTYRPATGDSICSSSRSAAMGNDGSF